jgi:hypothetical protein
VRSATRGGGASPPRLETVGTQHDPQEAGSARCQEEKTVIPVPETEIVDVRVLASEGCPHTPATIALIEEVARESGIPIRMETALVRTQEEAEAQRFLGSPTVQVNGVDLDPEMRERADYGFA